MTIRGEELRWRSANTLDVVAGEVCSGLQGTRQVSEDRPTDLGYIQAGVSQNVDTELRVANRGWSTCLEDHGGLIRFLRDAPRPSTFN